MAINATSERGDFLDEKQKEVKGQIMQELIDVLYGNIEKNSALFLHHPQELSDLVFSVLIMFNRESLVHLLQTFGIAHERKEILRKFCEVLKDEVNAKIKTGLM